jgi:WD40 repeat protein
MSLCFTHSPLLYWYKSTSTDSAAAALDNTQRSWDPMRLCFTYSLLLYWHNSTSTDSSAAALDNTLRSWDPMRLCFTYSLLLYWHNSTSTDSSAAALDNTLRSWDPMSLSCSFVLKEAGESEMSCFGVLPRMRAIVTGNVQPPPTPLYTHAWSSKYLYCCASKASKLAIVTGNDDGSLRLWDLASGKHSICQVSVYRSTHPAGSKQLLVQTHRF